jgi:hypothetical protein
LLGYKLQVNKVSLAASEFDGRRKFLKCTPSRRWLGRTVRWTSSIVEAACQDLFKAMLSFSAQQHGHGDDAMAPQDAHGAGKRCTARQGVMNGLETVRPEQGKNRPAWAILLIIIR